MRRLGPVFRKGSGPFAWTRTKRASPSSLTCQMGRLAASSWAPNGYSDSVPPLLLPPEFEDDPDETTSLIVVPSSTVPPGE